MIEVLVLAELDIPAEIFAIAFSDTYNRREAVYASCKGLIEEPGAPLENTLLWEFSKILHEYVNEFNPGTLMFLYMVVKELTDLFFETCKMREVFAE